MSHVADHANDREPRPRWKTVRPDTLTQRVFVRPKDARGGLIDNRYSRRSGHIASREGAASLQRDAQRAKVVGVDHAMRGIGALTGGRGRASLNGKTGVVAVTSHRESID